MQYLMEFCHHLQNQKTPSPKGGKRDGMGLHTVHVVFQFTFLYITILALHELKRDCEQSSLN